MAYCSVADVQELLPDMVLESALKSEYHILSLVYLSGGIVLAGTYPNGKILRSTDYGLTWTNIGQLGVAESVLGLTYLDGVAVAGTSPGGKIYRSVDYGETWTDKGQLGAEEYVNALISFGEDIVLAGTSPGGKIYRSVDNGLTWADKGQLGAETSIYSLAHVSSVVLAGTSPGGKIFRSIDYGLTWSDEGQLGTTTEVLSLGQSEKTDGYFGPRFGVYSCAGTSDGYIFYYQSGWKSGGRLSGQTRANVIGCMPAYGALVGTGEIARLFEVVPLLTVSGNFYGMSVAERGASSVSELEAFIAGADAEINTYCQKRYGTQIPFDPVPGIIKWISARLAAAELWMAIRRADPEATYEYLYAKQLQLRGVAIGKLMEIAAGMVDIYGADADYSIPMFGTVDSESVFDDIGGAVREA